jgi:hypothetical protein
MFVFDGVDDVDEDGWLSTSIVVAVALLVAAVVVVPVFGGGDGSTGSTPNVINQKSLSECTASSSETSGSVSGTSGKPKRPSNSIRFSSLL